ncbi:MAG: heavy metal-binding domain-containing protein [Bacteroidota bacterium]
MKKVIFSVLVLALVFSCNKKTEETTTETGVVTTDTVVRVVDTVSTEPEVESLYSCSMHPEVQGKLNDECSKCGMKLSELVPKK